MTNMTEFYIRIYWLNKSDSLTTPLGKGNLNRMDSAIKTLDGRTVELYTETVRLDTTKADKNQLKNMVTNWEIDDRTGIVTLTKYDGTKLNINTALNQLAVNFEYDAIMQQLIITQTDGTQKIVDLSALITQYEFLDTNTITFSVDVNGKVSAIVKEGSINEKHLDPDYLADIKVQMSKAEGYAKDAQDSADNAAYDAKLSQSYAVGGSGIRENEDTDNSLYYYVQTKELAENAKTITSYVTEYQAGASGIIPPDGEWTAEIPEVEKGQYLWARITISLSDGESVVAYNVSYFGEDGEGIQTLTASYAVSDSQTTVPTENWLETIPEVPAGKYLWTRITAIYADETAKTLYLVAGFGSGGGGNSDTAKALLNTFDTRPTSMNIDFSDPKFQNKVTYMLASSSTTEGKPPEDANVINLGWDYRFFGKQLAFGDHVYYRSCNNENFYTDWFTFLTTRNLTDMLAKAEMTNAASTSIGLGLPAAGTPSSNEAGAKEFSDVSRSGLYTLNLSSGWYNFLLIKHRNGAADGNKYALYIASLLTNAGNLVWNKEYNGTWQGERIILDNVNYSDYISKVRDNNNGIAITFAYSKTGLNYSDFNWLAGWNGYELRAVSKNQFMGYKKLTELSEVSNIWNVPIIFNVENAGALVSGYSTFWHVINLGGYSGGGYTAQLAIPYENSLTDSELFIRVAKGNVFREFRRLVHEGNYGSIITKVASVIDYGDTSRIIKIGYAGAGLNSSNANYLAAYTESGTKIKDINNVEARKLIKALGAIDGEFWGMSLPSGDATSNSSWIRTTVKGIIPYEKGNIDNGHSNIGSSDWYFNSGYISSVYSKRIETYFFNLYQEDAKGAPSEMRINDELGFAINIYSPYYAAYINNYVDSKEARLKVGVVIESSSSGNQCVRPGTDNYGTLGKSNYRWKDVYATSPTISTSDLRLKKDVSYIGQPSEYETKMSDTLLVQFIEGLIPCIFLRTEGESGRPHHGLIAQDVEKLLKRLGIKDHAGFIKSPKMEKYMAEEEMEVEEEEPIEEEVDEEIEEEGKDENGNPITTTKKIKVKKVTGTIKKKVKKIISLEKEREIPGEYVYGLRYEEFISDILRYCQIQGMKIKAQEEKINQQQKETEDLQARLERLEAAMLY